MVKSKELKIMRKKIEKADRLANPLHVLAKTERPDSPDEGPFAWPADASSSAAPSPTSTASSNIVLDAAPFSLQAMTSSEMKEELRKEVLRIFEENMGDLYRSSSWGLDMDEKRQELQHRKARFLLVRSKEQGGELAAFVHYRFDFDDEERPDGAVVYIFEIQVAAAFRRQRLGRSLMEVLEEVAHQTNMSKVVLTVFKKNVQAMEFYRQGLGYEVDESSPSQHNSPADYEILSKIVP
jgi:ribosomal protein S18 acetylase RimI-like enzyme